MINRHFYSRTTRVYSDERNAYSIFVLMLIFTIIFFLAGEPETYSEEITRQVVLENLALCCFQGAEYKNSGGVLLLKEPINYAMYDYANLENFDIDPVNSLISNLKFKSNIDIINSVDDESKINIAMLVLPNAKNDLTSDQITRIKHLFNILVKGSPATQKQNSDAIDKMIEELYKNNDSKIEYIRVKEFIIIDSVVIFNKMLPGNVYASEFMQISLLQALDYNFPGKHIEGSIFSIGGDNPILPAPTELDFETVGMLYRNKALRIIRSLSDLDTK